MGKRRFVDACVVGSCLALSLPFATAAAKPIETPPPSAAGSPASESPIPDRSAVAVRSAAVNWGTPNQHERRAGLSLTKLFLADYALSSGDRSTDDRTLCEQMISYSDDAAAEQIDAKYPQAIDAVATRYSLSETMRADTWGNSTTSAADVSDFLAAKQRTEPNSPLFTWMAAAGATAADGTAQDWGTARLPSVRGTKWGWSDSGEPEVASASYGPGFTVTAHTRGTAQEQTDDVLTAFSVVGPVFGPR